MSDDEEDDFGDLFADFNMEDEDMEEEDRDFIDSISDNLREAAGMGAGKVLHQGDVDEGLITWVAPEKSGLDNLEDEGFAAQRRKEEEVIRIRAEKRRSKELMDADKRRSKELMDASAALAAAAAAEEEAARAAEQRAAEAAAAEAAAADQAARSAAAAASQAAAAEAAEAAAADQAARSAAAAASQAAAAEAAAARAREENAARAAAEKKAQLDAATESMWDDLEMLPSPGQVKPSTFYMSDNLAQDLHQQAVTAANKVGQMGPESAARAIDALQTLRLAMPTFKDALHVAAAELTTTEEGKTLLTCFLEGKKRRKNSKEVLSHPA